MKSKNMPPFKILAKLLDLENVPANRGLWIGFTEGSKPIAILPAGRSGEVCDAKKMSKQDFDWLIKTHNDRWNASVKTLLVDIETDLTRLGRAK
jgi:hypothetical protein